MSPNLWSFQTPNLLRKVTSEEKTKSSNPLERELERQREKIDKLGEQNDVLTREKTKLHKQAMKLQSELESVFKELAETQKKERDQMAEIEHLRKNILPLKENLSDDDRLEIQRSPKKYPYTLILQGSLKAFKTLEIERTRKDNLWDEILKTHEKDTEKLGKRHERMIIELTDRHFQEKQDLEDGHDTRTRKLEADHQIILNRLQVEIDSSKNALLKNVDHFRPISDGNLKERFAKLRLLVENLARQSFGAESVHVRESFMERKFVPPQRHRRFLLEGDFWAILVDGIFSTPFRVFGTYGNNFLETWCILFQRGNGVLISSNEWPPPNLESEKWRSLTFEALRQQVEARPGDHPPSKEIKDSQDISLQETRHNLSKALLQVSHDRPNEIREIVDEALKLALDFGTQRFRLRLFAPQIERFCSKDRIYCRDMNNANAEAESGIVQLIIGPGLSRVGDSRGYAFGDAVYIYPAAVYLMPP